MHGSHGGVGGLTACTYPVPLPHMKPLTIQKDTSVFLVRPAKPMPQSVSDAITVMVRGIDGIREAHLPQCFVKDVFEPPAQILVLVLDPASDRTALLTTVGDGLAH